MRARIFKTALCLLAVIFALGIVLLPGNRVKADGEDPMLVLGVETAIDFQSGRYWWFKFETNKSKLVEISSSGKTFDKVEFYEGNKETTSRKKTNYNGMGDGTNFKMNWVAKAGVTYYIQVMTYSATSAVNPANDTKIVLSDLTNSEVIVNIDEAHFPDPVFRDYVKTFDFTEDNILTRDEMELVTKIDTHNLSGVTSLKGVEYFEKVTDLDCANNDLVTLDVSALKLLRTLNVYNNKSLTSLKIKGCTNLRELTCSDCVNLPSSDITSNNMLKKLTCSNMNLKSLDLSQMRYLEYLYCKGNEELKTLDVSNCRNLGIMDCSNNALKSLDVSNCSSLTYLYLQDNQILEELKLNNTIHSVEITNNKISKLDLSGCNSLAVLMCSETGIKAIDLTDCPYLAVTYDPSHWEPDYGYYYYRFGANDTICTLQINDGTVVTVNAGDFDRYIEINETNFPDPVFRDKIKRYDNDSDGWFSKNEIDMITDLYYTIVNNPYAEKISSLKGIEHFKNLRKLYCGGNDLTELDISGNLKLTTLYCNNNKLTKLDLSNNKELNYVLCTDNMIEKLDVSSLQKLTDLICYSNDLKTLTLGENSVLENLVCGSNKLTSLDISGCPKIIRAYKEGENKVGETTFDYVLRFEQNYIYQLQVDKTVKVKTGDPEISAMPTPSADPTAKPTTNPAVTEKPTSKPTGTPAEPTKAAAVSLALNKKTANVICGKTLTLKATLTGSSDKITWKSSDTKVATVDANGKITSKMAGATTITATAAGKSAKCVVTVLYKDVTNSKDFWYAPTNYLTAKGVVKGYDKQTKFNPANKCTRAQMVTFIWRLQGEPKPKASKCKFSDVKKTDYFYKACIWGNENHIVEGYKDGTFGPQIVCARKHAVTFLWRLANKPKPASTKNKFKDVKKSDYFYTATLWASEKKILAGYSDGTFRPNGDCLRRQMVTFLYKYDKFVNGKG